MRLALLAPFPLGQLALAPPLLLCLLAQLSAVRLDSLALYALGAAVFVGGAGAPPLPFGLSSGFVLGMLSLASGFVFGVLGLALPLAAGALRFPLIGFSFCVCGLIAHDVGPASSRLWSSLRMLILDPRSPSKYRMNPPFDPDRMSAFSADPLALTTAATDGCRPMTVVAGESGSLPPKPTKK